MLCHYKNGRIRKARNYLRDREDDVVSNKSRVGIKSMGKSVKAKEAVLHKLCYATYALLHRVSQPLVFSDLTFTVEV